MFFAKYFASAELGDWDMTTFAQNLEKAGLRRKILRNKDLRLMGRVTFPVLGTEMGWLGLDIWGVLSWGWEDRAGIVGSHAASLRVWKPSVKVVRHMAGCGKARGRQGRFVGRGAGKASWRNIP